MLILLSVVLRLVPHPPNFTPLGASAIFAGRTLSKVQAVAITLAACLISDLFLALKNGYPLFSWVTPWVYLGCVLQVGLGRVFKKSRGGAFCAAAAGACVFFFLSNFGVWLSGVYGYSMAGLTACYVAAIPFFWATLVSNVLWTLILNWAYRFIASKTANYGRFWAPQPANALSAY